MPKFTLFGNKSKAVKFSEMRRRGDACRDGRQLDEAVAWYRAHLDEYPEDFPIWVQLGNCLKDDHRWSEGERAYWRAISLNGLDADVFLQLGHLYKLAGRKIEAIGCYQASVQRGDSFNPAIQELEGMGGETVAVGALRGLRRSARPKSSPSEDRSAGDRHRDAGRWEDASVAYLAHLASHPDDFDIWVQAGNCLKESGQLDPGLRAYWRAIALNPGDADVFVQAGHLHKLAGRTAAAAECYRDSILRQPNDNPAELELLAIGGTLPVDAWSATPRSLSMKLAEFASRLDKLDSLASAQEVVPGTASLPQPEPSPPEGMPQLVAAEQDCIYLLIDSLDESVTEEGRSLLQALEALGHRVRLVRWLRDEGQFELVLPSAFSPSMPGALSTPRQVLGSGASRMDAWLLVWASPGRLAGDFEYDEMRVTLAARRLGLRTAFTFRGAAPLRLQDSRGEAARNCDLALQALLLADVVFTTSTAALSEISTLLAYHQSAEFGPALQVLVLPTGPRRQGSEGEWASSARELLGFLMGHLRTKQIVSGVYFLVGGDGGTRVSRFQQYLPRALAQLGIEVLPARWDATKARLVSADVEGLSAWRLRSGRFLGGVWGEPGASGAPRWLIHSCGISPDELRHIAIFAKANGMRCAAIYEGEAGPQECSVQLLEVLASFDKVFAASEPAFSEFSRFILSWRGRVHSAEDRFRLLEAPNETPGLARRAPTEHSATMPLQVVAWALPNRIADAVATLDALVFEGRRGAVQLELSIIADDDVTRAAQWKAAEEMGQDVVTCRWIARHDEPSIFAALEEADFAIVPDGAAASPLVAMCQWAGLPCLASRTSEPGQRYPGQLGWQPGNDRQLIEGLRALLQPAWRLSLASESFSIEARTWLNYATELSSELRSYHLVEGQDRISIAPIRSVLASFPNLSKRPKLSVCISTYNRAGWLSLSLRNLFAQLSQPSPDIEILVVDNTSTDHTPEVVVPFLSRSDFRYVRNRRNVGMLGNLAVTAQQSRGDYVWILGDDDLVRPGTVMRIRRILEEHPALSLIYMNYGYTTEPDPAAVSSLDEFLANFNLLEPPGPDELGTVKGIAAKCENFFTAIYSHVYRRDHALKAYCQDTSGPTFSTMLSCVPTAYYVLHYMADEPAYWIGEPSLVVNSNVSWQDHGVLLDLEQLPRTWDLAERVGADPAQVDIRRANRLWLIEMMWRQILENDRSGNSAFFSAPRVLNRIKHLPEFDKHVASFAEVYGRAYSAGHPAARMPPESLFAAFRLQINGTSGVGDGGHVP